MKILNKIEYFDEDLYKSMMENLRRYKKSTYPVLRYDTHVELMQGYFWGDIVKKDEESETYDLKIDTSEIFEYIYGKVMLNYTVYKDKHLVKINSLTPVLPMVKEDLVYYKGIGIPKDKEEEYKKRIDLFLERKGKK